PPPSEAPQGGEIPRTVDAVIMRGLSKDAARRYGNAEELAEALRAAYEGAGLVDPLAAPAKAKGKDPTGGFRRTPVTRRPSSAIFYALVAVALLAGVGLIVAFRAQRPASAETALDPTSPLA